MAILLDHLWDWDWVPGQTWLTRPSLLHRLPAEIARLRANPANRAEFLEIRRRAAASEIFVVDDVCDYYFATAPRTHYQPSEFPCIAPPYEDFWIEMRAPDPLARRAQGGLMATDRGYPARWGFYFHAAEAAPFRGQVGYEGVALSVLPEARWIYSASLFIQADKTRVMQAVIGPVGGVLLQVGADGALLDLAVPVPLDLNPDLAAPPEWINATLMQPLMPALMALCFLNCKNVPIRQAPGPAAENRARRARGLKPFFRHKTLDIGPIREILRSAGAEDGEGGLAMALKLRRGHFKVYTEERKLFGKHTGRYYWPPSAVGRASSGVISKQYRVRATPGVLP